MGDRQFVIHAPSVVSETIDGEVVIMNLTSGNYYSTDNAGAAFWGWIDERRTFSEIERLASRRYDAAAEEIAAALAAFFDRLIEEKLIRETTVRRLRLLATIVTRMRRRRRSPSWPLNFMYTRTCRISCCSIRSTTLMRPGGLGRLEARPVPLHEA